MGNLCGGSETADQAGKKGKKPGGPSGHKITDKDVWKQVDDLWKKNGLEKT